MQNIRESKNCLQIDFVLILALAFLPSYAFSTFHDSFSHLKITKYKPSSRDDRLLQEHLTYTEID